LRIRGRVEGGGAVLVPRSSCFNQLSVAWYEMIAENCEKNLVRKTVLKMKMKIVKRCAEKCAFEGRRVRMANSGQVKRNPNTVIFS